MQESLDLQTYNTFGISVRARWFCAAQTLPELREALAFAQSRQLPTLVLGGGSNVLLREDFPGLVVHMALKGIALQSAVDDAVSVRVASGENWHGFVEHCLQQGWHGLENLALIPGSVGAAPIQNIGAYGVEVKDFITELEVLDMVNGDVFTLSCAQCRFGYRDSIFKHDLAGTTIVLSVTLRLHRHTRVNVSYAALAQALAHQAAPQPRDVFETVCAIRRSKLPDPAVLGNAGSFFKNPIITQAIFEKISQLWPEVPGFAVNDPSDTENSDPRMKIPAAWLIDKAGWKGRVQGRAAVYQEQPLVLINLGGARADEVIALAQQVMNSVEQKFGVRLEPEVQWIPPFDRPESMH